MKDIIQTPNVLLFDTSLLLRETLVVLGEAEDRFVHSVLWSLGSPHSPLSHKIYDTRCQNSTNECLLSFCLLFLNENIFKIWSKKIWVFQVSPSFPLFSTVLFLLSVSDKMYDTRCLQEMSKLLNVRLFFMGLFCLPCIAAEDHSTLTGFAITDTTSCMEFRNKVQKCTEFQEFVNSKTWPNVCLFFLGHFLLAPLAVLL